MGHTVLAVVQGTPPDEGDEHPAGESFWKTLPIVASLAVVVMMGVWIPKPVAAVLHEALRFLGGSG
jgi:hypothetical protein